ncbi:Cof-type HAD-IIB family hydrolase [Spiroplasma tabanidicola]|uniref:HAD superfamily hydrolase n=1 Tax=Spiroplasma tabanidicola TaxID=324079 RepID=A0A6I6CBN8_9MOLU|nr:Cof-type HAD-IIB family hydrolase [Spiroplasma tabanidicola]QGS51618.1 HAD superfamily hydrolase [Spiroplasma tabanidicola]
MINKNIELIALDMDGTSYKSLGKHIESNLEPINKVLENGKKVVFVTGRPFESEANELHLYNFKKNESFMIAFNGAVIYDILEKKVIQENVIQKGIVEKVFEILNKEEYKDTSIWAYSKNNKGIFINKSIEDNKLVEVETKLFDGIIHIVGKNTIFTDCYKILLIDFDKKLIEELKEIGLNVFWHDGSISAEVTSKNVDKAIALKYILKHYNIDPSQVMAMGDGANDIPMLDYAGLSIVPANAKDEIKKHAKVISKYTFLEGAVGMAIKKYILGE